MQLLLIIAGLILILAGGSWFPGAVTVGIISLVAGAALIILPLVFGAALLGFTSKRASKMLDRMDRDRF